MKTSTYQLDKVKTKSTKNALEFTSKNIFGVSIFDQKTFDDILELSGLLAQDNEFQVHYTALYLKQIIDNDEIYINIPLVFYNYKQEVSSATIKFHLKDVEEMHNLTLELAQAKANEVLDLLGDLENFTYEIVGTNSIHRHPGGAAQSFSATDLKTNLDNPGIVYPLDTPKNNTPNFAGIWYVQKDSLKLAHNEIRVAYTNDEGNTCYDLGRAVTLISGYTKHVSTAESLFGILPDTIESYRISKDGLKSVPKFIEDIVDTIYSNNYTPEILVEEENIKEKLYIAPSYGHSHGKKETKDKGEYYYIAGKGWGYHDEIKTTIKEDKKNLLYQLNDELIDENFDLFEIDTDGKYVWNVFTMHEPMKTEYLAGIKDELLFCMPDKSYKTIQKLNNMKDWELVKLAKENHILSYTPKEVKYK